VLLRGERGSGKELVAAAIHLASPRKNGPFVTLNCSALSEGLLECEVFGQEENAFNNAPFRRGRFELAHKGTLFLDEIGNMPQDFQQKILRVLEYQSFERVGGGNTIKVDVRVVAATNADLEKEMRSGKFREDLYDRLAFESLRMPPLRERREDIPVLAAHFLRVIGTEVPGIEPERFSPEAEARLGEYAWPGNIRELKFYVERVAYRTRSKTIDLADLPPFRETPQRPEESSSGAFHERVAEFRKKLIQDALAGAGGDRARAASSLALTAEEFEGLAGATGSRV
jgi:DNA-binding NtrC family response regulator